MPACLGSLCKSVDGAMDRNLSHWGLLESNPDVSDKSPAAFETDHQHIIHSLRRVMER